MSLRRLGLVFGLELRSSWRRPIFWILVLLLAFLMWGLSSGHVRIESGDASVGGTKAVVTSQFSIGAMLAIVVFICYSFFISVIAGMTVIRDEELKTTEILHSTPLRAGEYIWGKFLAILASFLALLGIQLVFAMFFLHLLPHPGKEEFFGPFHLASFLRPALFLSVPVIVFFTGACFFIGERMRRPILVFILPVALNLLCGFFLWDWSPGWLDPRINRALMLIDPSGFRWMNETWLKVDRGVAFYNTAPIEFDVPFLLSRLVLVLAGLGCIAWSQKGFEARLRGAKGARVSGRWPRLWPLRRPSSRSRRPSLASARSEGSAPDATGVITFPRPLASLGMRSSPPGFLASLVEIARVELRELRSHPGLYLFVPIILLQTLGSSLLALGAFDTPLLITPGTVAVRMMNTLTLLVCLLLLFYTTESLNRERATGIGSIWYVSPVRTASILFGKAIANSMVATVVLLAAYLGSLVALLFQGKVAPALGPFLLVWGLLLLPTFILWSTFVTAVLALTRNRYTTYGIGLGALILTGYLQFRQKMNWAGNWDLWNAVRWSDMGVFELDRTALLLNRLLAVGLSILFVVLAVRLFPRRDLDAVRIIHRLSPPRLLGAGLRLSPYAIVPVFAAGILWMQVNRGFQGKSLEKRAKDYWKQNLATWKDAPLPTLAAVDLGLTLEPAGRWFRVEGSYDLVNRKDAPIARVPLTGGFHWTNVAWTMNGKESKPEDRTSLYVFTPERPLAPGDHVRISFRYEGTLPPGITKNGGGTEEFILPSGVVLTSFSPSFVPVLGYMEEIGIKEEENRYEPKVYSDDFYKEINDPLFVSGTFTTRIRITAPQEYTLNSVGSLTSEKVEVGRRTVVWESDHPVKFFNVVAGRWNVKRGERTAIYYNRRHPYNIDEMSEALSASLRYYSEWFHPFPWKELKLSEFPDLASYAQGFPTNITFSEGIGFLTRSDPKAEVAFLVTAHEAAHQWWGSILTPGKGPGGNILSEGMAHFSSILLMGQVKGERERIELCKRLEERYGDRRQADSERPLVKIDGSRPGDTTVTYDKGGWAAWMLMQLMGRDAMLAGLREFITKYELGPDYPLLQDYIETLRGHAPDPAAFDAFVHQWYFEVVVPEYRLSEAKRSRAKGASPAAGATAWDGTDTRRAASNDAGGGDKASQGRTGAEAAEHSRESLETGVLRMRDPLRNVAASTIPAMFHPERRGSPSDAPRADAAKGPPSHADAAKEPSVRESAREPSAQMSAGAATNKAWEVTVTVTNAGKAKMPIEVAAVRGERFKEDGSLSADYHDCRTTLILGAGESKTAKISCGFEPERVVVDPDAKVLQLRRKSAVATLE